MSPANPHAKPRSSSTSHVVPDLPNALPRRKPAPLVPDNRRNSRGRKKRAARKTKLAAAQEAKARTTHRLHLAFRQKLVDKYGVITNTVRIPGLGAAQRLAHSIKAFIGLRVFEAVMLAGWTVEKLLAMPGWKLVEWDGRCAVSFFVHSPFPHFANFLIYSFTGKASASWTTKNTF